VQYVPPPAHLVTDVTSRIGEAVAHLRDGDIALVVVADRKSGGGNAALVAKDLKGFDVMLWLGKSWGDNAALDWGVAVRRVWRFDTDAGGC
jgi:hypothetical protein